MKLGRASRRSVRYSVFIGVLAGSVFSGSGAFAVDPIPITTQAELEAIGSSDSARASDYFLNFVESELILTNPSNSTYITGTFTGTFDGNGKTLSGLTRPLFDVLGSYVNSAEVSDLVLATASGTGVNGRGVLSNDLVNSTVNNVSASGTLTSNSDSDVGGLIGVSIEGNIYRSSADVSIAGTGENVGGLVGRIESTQIQNSSATGDVTGVSHTGGLVGNSLNSSIETSSSTGTVASVDVERIAPSAGENIGGFAGRIENTQIKNSLASGDVTGGSNTGGLVGKSLNSSIENSHSTGTVSSVEQQVNNSLSYFCETWWCEYIALPVFTTQQNIGGLIGESTNSNIFNSYSAGAISGNQNIGGLIGNSTSDVLANTSSSSEVIGVATRLRRSVISAGWGGGNDLLIYEESQPLFVGGLVGNATDITVTNSSASGSVEGLDNVGGLIGLSTSGVISNSSASGAVTGSRYIGGLIGNSDANSILNNARASGAVIGIGHVGGLIGTSGNSTISNASFSGFVGNSTGTSGDYFGGLIGKSDSDDISYSRSSGTVTSNGSYVGGLVGDLNLTSTISNSNATGDVSTFYEYVGGLVGKSLGGISDSYATGNVTGAGYVGGLVGHLTGDLVDTYSTGEINGGTYSGGLVGYLEGNINNSYSTSAINQLSSLGNRIGGLIGIIGSGSISNCYATGGGLAINGNEYVGGLVGGSSGSISSCYAIFLGNVTGVGYVGGLVGDSSGLIDNSFANISGNVSSSGGYVGGLVGATSNEITNSFARVNGNVSGVNNYVGGLSGTTSSSIANSYADVSGNISGYDNVGGLSGYTWLSVTNSYSNVIGDVEGNWNIGGLIGEANHVVSNSFASISNNIKGAALVGGLVGNSWNSIDNSYSLVLNNVIGSENTVGGLVGFILGGISNSYANVSNDVIGASYVGGLGGGIVGPVTNSYSKVGGQVSGDSNVGRLAGFAYGDLTNSYAIGEILTAGSPTSELVSLGSPTTIDSCGAQINTEELFECIDGLSIEEDFNFENVGPTSNPGLVSPAGELGIAFATDECLNGPNPYLISLFSSYENSCSGGDPTPPPSDQPIRERIERESREIKEVRTLEKIEKPLGFKNESPLPKTAAISFIETTEKIDLAKVKAVEIAPTANVKVAAKAGEALQISLKSESKEPVELWVKSPDGSWLLAGVITFDMDGKAILPPLQFKSAGDYTLVLNKPSADSAKGSAPLNQSGSVLVAVS